MLTSLTLKNWRTHAETTLEFGKGTNVIVGVMGSGKSSIVNAISYSLFGTFPAIKTRQVSLDEIIMNKPNQADRAETILEFTQEEKKYRIERIIKRDGTNEAKLLEGTRLIAGPKQKDVNEKVENLLGLNYELFSRAVYAEQNEMDFFLKLSPSERKKKFDELLELEKYETARKNSVTLQNELLKENKQRKDFVAQQKETLKSHEEENLQKLILEEENAINLLRNEIETIKKELLIIEKEYTLLSDKEKQNKTLEELAIKVNSRIEGLKEDILRSERISVGEVQTQSTTRKKEIVELKEKLTTKEKEWKEIDLVLKKSGEELKVLEYENRKLSEEEKGISSLKGKCPTCKQELNEEHKTNLTKELAQKTDKILEQIRELQKHKKDLEEKYKTTETEKETLRKNIDE
ncbi:MAG: SMC family ATPase, partial [archaeon]